MKRLTMVLALAALAGCAGQEETNEKVVGAAAPILALTAPAAGAALPFGPVTVAGTATADAGIDALELVLDGGAVQAVDVGAAGAFEIVVEPGEGAHTLRLVLRDALDREAVQTVSFTVAAELVPAAPVLTLATPVDGVELPFGGVEIAGSAVAEAGVASLILAVDGGDAAPVEVGSDGTFSARVEPGEGTHVVTLVLTDLRDREATASVEFTVLPAADVTPPVVALEPVPALTTIRQVFVRGVATDDRAVASVRFVHGEDERVLDLADGGSFEVSVVPFRGENVVELVAADAAGNESTSTVSFFYGQIATAGAAHTGVIRDGVVWAWGRHNKGQAGIGGEMSNDNSPRAPVALTDMPAVHWISFAQNHSVAVGMDGTVWTWGANDDGQLGLGTPPAGEEAGLADTVSRATPQQVPGITDAVAAAGGYNHTLVLREDGTVVAFGRNGKGQLGDGGTESRSWPMPVDGLTDVVKLIGGSEHSAALRADGTLFLFGRNQYGNLAQGSIDAEVHPTPMPAQGLAPVVDLASGRDHLVAIHADGTASSWGLNASGQLGDMTEENRGTPGAVLDLDGAVAVYANGNYTMARKADGTLWGWGQGGNNQFGVEPAGDRMTPTEPALGLADVVSVGCGATHVVAVRADGTVFTWGWNIYGSLGNPLLANNWAVPTPTALELP